MKKLYILLMMCCCMLSMQAQSIAGYEYWFDNYFDKRTQVNDGSGTISLELDVSAISPGMHCFHFRAKDTSGLWSNPFSSYFFRTETLREENQMSQYEYWLNNNYSERKSGSLGADGMFVLEPLDVSSLRPGMHYFNFRARDSFGGWSSPVTHYFYRPEASRASNKLTNYEYWLDANHSERKSGALGADGMFVLDALDVSSLRPGMHYFNFRARDSFGGWSSPVTHYFYRPEVSRAGNKLTNYEYWLDTNYDGRTQSTLNEDGVLQLDHIDVSALSEGMHYFSFRAQDSFGAWSNPVTHYFYRLSRHVPVKNLITHYRYMFNNDENTLTTVTLTPPVNPLEWNGQLIEVPSMKLNQLPDSFGIDLFSTAGEATLKIQTDASFMIQFKDSTTSWSQPVISDFEHNINKKATLSNILLNQAFTINKPLGDVAWAYRIDVTKENAVYWKSDQPCRMALFDSSGKWIGKVSDAELLQGYSLSTLKKGSYYAVLHSAVKNAQYDKETLTVICVGRTENDTIHVDMPGTLPQLIGDPNTIRNLTLTGYLNGTDIKFIRSLPLLEKLDIGGAHIVQGGDDYYKTYRTADEVVGDEMFTGLSKLTRLVLPKTSIRIGASAFKGCNKLEEFSIPATAVQVGTGIFTGCSNLLVIRWECTVEIEAQMFDAPLSMGNCLVYAPEGTAYTYAGNVVIGGTAEKITLRHARPFRCPTAFKAKSITYARNFSMASGKGISAGWETIVLPFTVQTYNHAQRGALAPFESGKDQTKPFWLRALTPTGFKDVTALEANTPYIISMPNSSAYEEEFNIRGEVTFQAESTEGVEVRSTGTGTSVRPLGPDFTFVASFEPTLKHDTVYAINLEPYENVAAGGAFVRNLRNVSPFEAYAVSRETPALAPKLYSIGGGSATGLDRMLLKSNKPLKTYTQEGILYIESDKVQSLPIYATDGRMVRIVDLTEGLNCIEGLEEGIYLLENVKIRIGR